MKIATSFTRGNSRKLAFFENDKVVIDSIEHLIDQIQPNDLIIVNDSATAPALVQATMSNGANVELRIVKTSDRRILRAVAFPEGNWRTPTEDRGSQPITKVGATLNIEGKEVVVTQIDGPLVTLRIDDPVLNQDDIFKNGKMVQYSYMKEDVPIWAAQTIFATRPWSSEAPSATYALNWRLIFKILEKGVSMLAISHAAGLSSIGRATDDKRLPLPEVSQVSRAVLEKIAETRRGQSVGSNGRIIAVGTSVVRAVECAWELWGNGNHNDEPFTNTTIISKSRPSLVFDGILSGLHDESESHYKLLSSFCSPEKIKKLLAAAEESECLTHEFGDFMLLFK